MIPVIYASDAFNERISHFMDFDISGEVYSSLIVMGIIVILAIIVGIQAHFHNPLKKTKGLLFLAETGVNFFDGQVEKMMGPKFKGFGGFVLAIAVYLFLAFIFGMTGLPSPMTDLAVPLSLGLTTFLMIHLTSVHFTHWKYFKRYVDPNPIFMPINLVSMWSPLISLSLRLFGNAIAGWVLMTILYSSLESLSAMIFTGLAAGLSSIWIAPIITPILHCYFDLFAGFIQTTVFIFFSMILIGQEGPQDIEQELSLRGGN
ncbi:MAG: F0F1 ATP synthase subunit A [Coprobacillus sp.]|nr:F0F1 ATP synthase subunit A [Coprobacillus sp.]